MVEKKKLETFIIDKQGLSLQGSCESGYIASMMNRANKFFGKDATILLDSPTSKMLIKSNDLVIIAHEFN